MRLGFRLIRYRSLFFSTMGSLVGLLMLILLWIGGIRVITARSARGLRRLHGLSRDADLALHRPRLGPRHVSSGARRRWPACSRSAAEAYRDIASPAEPVNSPA